VPIPKRFGAATRILRSRWFEGSGSPDSYRLLALRKDLASAGSDTDLQIWGRFWPASPPKSPPKSLALGDFRILRALRGPDYVLRIGGPFEFLGWWLADRCAAMHFVDALAASAGGPRNRQYTCFATGCNRSGDVA
jgi:hypothetical protein